MLLKIQKHIRFTLTFAILLIAVTEPSMQAAEPPSTALAPVPLVAPSYPNDFVGVPELTTTAGRQSAGTARENSNASHPF